mmetsp:Transcript_8917/g.24030  ORF Transcript_8917/g.24030 Transcript_8917/m.24030 type:complete len:204 (+) Transcript_8917:579-1190(+)
MRQPCAASAGANGQGIPLLDVVHPEEGVHIGEHFVHRIAVEAQVRVVIPEAVHAAEQVFAAAIGIAVFLRQCIPGPLLQLDVLLHLMPRLSVCRDLRDRRGDVRVTQQPVCAVLLQKRKHSAQWPRALETQQLLNLRLHAVHQHIHELAVGIPHLVRIHHLVPPPNLERPLEKCLQLLEITLLDELLSLFEILRHRQTAQDGA